MKIYNNTKIDPKLMRRLLTAAAHTGGLCKPGDVAVRVTRGRAISHAQGQRGWWNGAWLRHKRGWYATKRRTICCNGLVELVISRPTLFQTGPQLWSVESVAERTYLTAVHEFRHIADHREGKRFGEYQRRWANRPHERRAISASRDAHYALCGDSRRQDLVIALALELERIEQERKK